MYMISSCEILRASKSVSNLLSVIFLLWELTAALDRDRSEGLCIPPIHAPTYKNQVTTWTDLVLVVQWQSCPASQFVQRTCVCVCVCVCVRVHTSLYKHALSPLWPFFSVANCHGIGQACVVHVVHVVKNNCNWVIEREGKQYAFYI